MGKPNHTKRVTLWLSLAIAGGCCLATKTSAATCNISHASRDRQLIYVHVFHTGGSTLKTLMCDTKVVGEETIARKSNCPEENFHLDLAGYKETFGDDAVDKGFKFGVMRDPLTWYQSVFKHAVMEVLNPDRNEQHDRIDCDDVMQRRDWATGFRFCLPPMRDFIARIRMSQETHNQTVFPLIMKERIFRDWIRRVVRHVPRTFGTQAAAWFDPRDSIGAGMDCIVSMTDLEYTWALLRGRYQLLDTPQESPAINNHVQADGRTVDLLERAVVREHSYFDCETSALIYNYAKWDFELLGIKCYQAMPVQCVTHRDWQCLTV